MRTITRTVLLLSIISLCTDMASEMLYPVLPLYLRSIGFSVVLIGVLEGVAEITASMSKGYFGSWSDAIGRRAPFVQIGYALSAFSKPMMAVLPLPTWVFAARTIDRLGKGIRTGARDAILAAETTENNKGAVFGFHRSMDTVGAALGPVLALVFLHFYPDSYRLLFVLAFAPGLVAILSSLLLQEHHNTIPQQRTRTGFFSFFSYWQRAPQGYHALVRGLLLFAVLNSSDVFLLLMLHQQGVSDIGVIGVYIFYNLVYALTAWPIGIVADKLGLRRIFLLGLALFAIVYGGMAFASSLPVFYALFSVYGLYAAATEGVSKAWIATLVPASEMGTAMGLYTSMHSICAFAASAIAGIVWQCCSPATTFAISSIGAVLVFVYFLCSDRNEGSYVMNK